MERLARCIEACPTVRLVATFQRFPTSRGGLRGFEESPPPEPCETSRSQHACPLLSGAGPCVASAEPRMGSMVHIYERRGQPAPERQLQQNAREAGLVLLTRTESSATQWVFRHGAATAMGGR